MTRFRLLVALLLTFGPCPAVVAAAAPAPGTPTAAAGPSVAVTTAPATRGSLPVLVEAWGTAVPAAGTATTVSLAADGEIVTVSATAGERVAAGATLLTFRPSAAATAQYRQAVTGLGAALTSRDSIAALLARHLATRDMRAAADKAVADAQAALAALRAAGAGNATLAVRAPFAAVVDTIAVGRGQRVAPGTPLATLVPVDGLVVTAGVDPSVLDTVRPGETASLLSLDRGGARRDGQVVRVDAGLDPKTGLVDVDMSPPAGGPPLLAGEGFEASIRTGNASGWIVAHAAVVVDGTAAALFQVSAGRARRVPVSVVLVRDGTDVVRGALDPAEPVVVDGSAQLSDGARVRPGGGA